MVHGAFWETMRLWGASAGLAAAAFERAAGTSVPAFPRALGSPTRRRKIQVCARGDENFAWHETETVRWRATRRLLDICGAVGQGSPVRDDRRGGVAASIQNAQAHPPCPAGPRTPPQKICANRTNRSRRPRADPGGDGRTRASAAPTSPISRSGGGRDGDRNIVILAAFTTTGQRRRTVASSNGRTN